MPFGDGGNAYSTAPDHPTQVHDTTLQLKIVEVQLAVRLSLPSLSDPQARSLVGGCRRRQILAGTVFGWKLCRGGWAESGNSSDTECGIRDLRLSATIHHTGFLILGPHRTLLQHGAWLSAFTISSWRLFLPINVTRAVRGLACRIIPILGSTRADCGCSHKINPSYYAFSASNDWLSSTSLGTLFASIVPHYCNHHKHDGHPSTCEKYCDTGWEGQMHDRLGNSEHYHPSTWTWNLGKKKVV